MAVSPRSQTSPEFAVTLEKSWYHISMKKLSLIKLHKVYIQGTEEKALVILQTIRLCNLSNAVMKVLSLTNPKTHLRARRKITSMICYAP